MNEFAIKTLNLDDLMLEFKLMKCLGYKSLFDPGFRREIRNPVRKSFYYRIMLYEEAFDRQQMAKVLEAYIDRVNYFQDPEMFRKVKDAEDQRALTNPVEMGRRVQHAQTQVEEALSKYTPMTDKERAEVAKYVENA